MSVDLIMAESLQVTMRENANEWNFQNSFLLSGYRRNYSSTRLVFRSLFIKHNELMSIWTHFFGSVFFLLLIFYVYFNFSDTKELYFQLKNDLKMLDLTGYVDKTYDMAWSLLKKGLRELNFATKMAKHVSSVDVLKAFAKNFSAQFADRGDIDKLTKEHADFKGVFANLTRIFFEKVALVLNNTSVTSSSELDFYLKNVYTSELEIFPVIVFLLSAIFCLFCSAVYHLFCDMSQNAYLKLRNFDYAGISLLISGSSFALLYYILYCRPGLVVFYSTCIFSFALVVFVISLFDFIHEPRNNLKKSLMYLGLGLLNVFPVLHIFCLKMWFETDGNAPSFSAGYALVALSGLIYIVGLFAYTHRFPERYYPITFDIWMNSHVVWHLCVFLGAALHFVAVAVIYRIRASSPC